MINGVPAQPATKEFVRFLSRNPAIRNQIRAAPDKTLLYSGAFFRPSYQEIKARKQFDPQVAEKETLPEVLARIPLAPALLPGASRTPTSWLMFRPRKTRAERP